MTMKFAFDGHHTAAAFCQYEEPELKKMTDEVLFRIVDKNSNVLAMETKEGVAARFGDLYGWRVNVRDGLNGICTIPEKVMVAMKHNGLLDTKEQLKEALDHSLAAALKAIARHAMAQTTRKGRKVELPVEPEFVISYAHNTRAGRLEGAVNLFVCGKGKDVNGRYRALDLPKLMNAQGEAQAAWNAALGDYLRTKGVLVLPDGKSVTAFGAATQRKTRRRRPQPQPARSQAAQPNLKAKRGRAKRQPDQTRQKRNASKAGPRKIPKNAGPGARKRAAKANARATPKRVVTYGEAWKALAGVFKADLARTAAGLLTGLDERLQRRMAKKAIKLAFRYHQRAGFARFAEGSVKAFALQVLTPHVRPDVFDRVWTKATADAARYGVEEVRLYPNGYRLFAPKSQLAAEDRVIDRLETVRKAAHRGLAPADVLGSLLRHKVGADVADVLELCNDQGGLRWASQYAPKALGFAALAHERNGRRVHVVGDPAVGKQLGRSAFTAAGFLDSATRTPHLRAIWTALREEGPFGDWLKAAGELRRAKPRTTVRKGDMIVVAPGNGLEDARSLEKLLAFAQKKGAKVVMAGAGAEPYRALTRQRGVHP